MIHNTFAGSSLFQIASSKLRLKLSVRIVLSNLFFKVLLNTLWIVTQQFFNNLKKKLRKED